MISEFLRSAREAEREADEILENAQTESRRICGEAREAAGSYRKQKQEEISRRAKARRELVQQEEDVKRKASRESTGLEIRRIREEAEKKEEEVIQFLLAEIF